MATNIQRRKCTFVRKYYHFASNEINKAANSELLKFKELLAFNNPINYVTELFVKEV
ncbi:hypothetical protein Bhyg_07178 [Pseudolycoriella hygida]|uniref:Uncharacterized protein n=1 Tax=Pseudolycoriella hygida TaxID=35572 RepID=A0A9Q0N3L7_9DIPT|nr:hypothetical protein Bhyg_07178 [Pseudolycoriella hygida]